MGTLQLAAACAAQARPRTIPGVCWPWVDATLGHPIPGHGASEGVDPSAAGELSADGSPPRLAAAWHAQHRAARGRRSARTGGVAESRLTSLLERA